jgi:hypothetical protein
LNGKVKEKKEKKEKRERKKKERKKRKSKCQAKEKAASVATFEKLPVSVAIIQPPQNENLEGINNQRKKRKEDQRSNNTD